MKVSSTSLIAVAILADASKAERLTQKGIRRRVLAAEDNALSLPAFSYAAIKSPGKSATKKKKDETKKVPGKKKGDKMDKSKMAKSKSAKSCDTSDIASQFGTLPPGLTESGGDALNAWTDFVEAAFPTWCVDENDNRVQVINGTCDVEGTNSLGPVEGRWDPFYLTKWHGGEAPELGGYPTDVDTRYPFYYASGFFGQACAGGNSHCSHDFDGSKFNCAKCGKIITDNDDGPNGPGHVPPHIGLAALTRAYHDGGFGDVSTWFNFQYNGCRVLPDVLFKMIRKYFPRDGDGPVAYPPPFTDNGGPGAPDGETYPYPLEFVNLVGDSCTGEQEKFPSAECFEKHSGGNATHYPDYLEPGHGSPHYCSKDAKAADVNNDWCPYIFFGDMRGRYRHPHIAFAAVETWLANKAGVGTCGPTWDDNDGANYPQTPNDNSVAFPKMEAINSDDPKQPKVTMSEGKASFHWPGDEGAKRKAVPGEFVIEKYIMSTTITS